MSGAVGGSSIRAIAGATASAVKVASRTTAVGVRVAGGVASVAVSGAATVATKVLPKAAEPTKEEESSLLRKAGYKAATMVVKANVAVARAGATATHNGAVYAASAVGSRIPLPQTLTDSDIAMGVAQVAAAAFEGAELVAGATATAADDLVIASANAAGKVAGHSLGEGTGELVRDAVSIAGSATHAFKTVGSLKANVAKTLVVSAVEANAAKGKSVRITPVEQDEVNAIVVQTNEAIATGAVTVADTASAAATTVATGAQVAAASVATTANTAVEAASNSADSIVTATTGSALGSVASATGSALGSVASVTGSALGTAGIAIAKGTFGASLWAAKGATKVGFSAASMAGSAAFNSLRSSVSAAPAAAPTQNESTAATPPTAPDGGSAASGIPEPIHNQSASR